jgi:uncharacterized repeat protein (TIGR01451 family)
MAALAEANGDTIRAGTPRHWRRCGGYNLDRFVEGSTFYWPQDDGPRDGRFNLSKLVSGGEGTLAVMTEIKLNLDIYNGTGGNNLAMQLVTDGLKLQPCSPGFVDGRNAILLADQNLTGGANQCVIWEAFAKRGLGFSADQGVSSSKTDGTEAFDLPLVCLQTLKITKSATPDPASAGVTLTYNLLVENDTPGTLTGVVVSDTVQANQTYVNGSATCGGSESGGIVTFPIGTMNSGTSVNCSFQVTVNGSLVPTQFYFDDFESGLGNWTTSGLWNLEGEGDTCGSQQAPFPSPTNAAYYGDASCDYNTGATSTGSLTMNSDVAIPGGASPSLKFSYFLETELFAGYDEAFIDISTNSGGAWTQLLQVTDSGWQEITTDLSAYAGNNVRLRFRFDTVDNINNGFFGWLVDDVEIIEEAFVDNTACVTAVEGDNDCDSITTSILPAPPAPATCSVVDDIPWLSASPVNGTIIAGNSTDVSVTYDSTGYGAGVYAGTLCIDSNDPVTPQVQVPVTLTVLAVEYSDLAGSYGIAWHFGDGSLRLGSSWTADSTFGLGDDDASDDGIVRANTPWVAGNGEVEDFVWGFGPTAVSLQTLNVPPSNTYIIWLMIGVLLLAFSTYLLIRRKRTI